MEFEFDESMALSVLSILTNDILQMDTEAAAFEQQAAEKEEQASQKEAEASSEEGSIPHYKEVLNSVDEYDSEGNIIGSREESTTVPDPEADAASLAKAASLRAEAVSLKAEAMGLRSLASALRSSSTATSGQQQLFNQAMKLSVFAVKAAGYCLKEGKKTLESVVDAFNVPLNGGNIIEWFTNVGENLLGVVGVDLSDGLNDEIYAAIGMATQLGVVVGAVAVKSVSALIGANLGNGILGYVGRQGLQEAENIAMNTFFTPTAAKVAQNAFASFLTSVGINALPTNKEKSTINAATIKNEEKISQKTFEEAKIEAKEKYAKYVAKLDCYTDEQKQDLISKYNEQIDKVEVLSDEEFFKQKNDDNPRCVAYYNGPDDKVYIRENYEGRIDVLIHEIGGHGTGSMSTEEGYYYTDPNTGENTLYTGKYEDSSTKLTWMGNYSGIGEATTEFLTRKINGEKSESNSYNSSVDSLESIVNAMTKYGGVNAEELLFESYTGNDKEKFAQKYNEMMGNDEAYDILNEIMQNANSGDPAYQKVVGISAGAFNLKCLLDSWK